MRPGQRRSSPSLTVDEGIEVERISLVVDGILGLDRGLNS